MVSEYNEQNLKELAREYVYGGFGDYRQFSRYKQHSDDWFSNIGYRHPELREYIQQFVRQRINDLAAVALQTEYDLLTSENHNVRLNAAKDLLSRGGLDAVVKQEITTNQITISIEEDNATDKPAAEEKPVQ